MNEPLFNRMPPQDLEAERAVLGGCLLSNRAIDDAQMVVQPNQFYSVAHQCICRAIYHLHNGGKSIDPVLVQNELKKRGEIEDVGGVAMLVRLMESVPQTAYTKHYAEIVYSQWLRRTVIDSWTEVAEAAYSETTDIEEAIEKHDTATQKLLESSVAENATLSLEEVFMAALTSDDEEKKPALMTELSRLDELSGGLVGGNLVVLAARASVGKTACAISLLDKIAKRGHKAFFVSLEMSKLEIAERLLSIESQVPSHVIRKNIPDEEQSQWLINAMNSLASLPIIISDSDDMTVNKIAAMTRLLKRSREIEMVVIDYLQLIEPSDHRVSREQQVSTITRNLKRLARSVGLPVLVLAQLNREVDKRPDKRPRLSDLRESGSIEQDADQVWFVYREDYHRMGEVGYEETGEAELIIAKNRNGPLGKVNMRFNKQTMHFVEEDPSISQAKQQSMSF